MNLDNIKQQATAAFGFEQLNRMQEEAVTTIADGRDTLLLAPTGTGKTLAYLLPVWARHDRTTLVVVPTRELAQQVADVFRRLHTDGFCTTCYGGHDFRIEQRSLSAQSGWGIIIGTPGRIKDHIERGTMRVDNIATLVLDEYDKSLEFGFEDEVKAVVTTLLSLSLRVLTSATHNTPIADYLGMRDYAKLDYTQLFAAPDSIENKREETSADAHRLSLRMVKSPVADKLETLRDLLLTLPDDAQAIVFSNYRESSERIAHYLEQVGIVAALYHGGMEQDKRDKALIRFRQSSVRVLVATDIASRGLDVPDVDHIIHYHLPQSEAAYVHRNGRTARALSSGTAYFILSPDEQMPDYATGKVVYYNLRPKPRFAAPVWTTVYVGRGKREKISRGDVLGFFTRVGGLEGQDIGRIDVMDHAAYCAVRSDVVHQALRRAEGQKIKGEKTHYLPL